MKNWRILRTLGAHGSRVLKRIDSVRRLGRCASESAASEFNSRDIDMQATPHGPRQCSSPFPRRRGRV